MLLTHANLFAPLDLKHRIFVKVPQVHNRKRTPGMNDPHAGPAPVVESANVHMLAVDGSPIASVLVDGEGTLVQATRKMRELFGLGVSDVGRPFRDLEVSYRPIELRSLIEQALADRRSVTRVGVERPLPGGEVQVYDVVVTPLGDGTPQLAGVQISFLDMTRSSLLERELERSREEIQTANEELQSANEELETTNEELQSTNEELETTNEELQSTNEELETMNEELQSTNEELQTLNTELRDRGDKINRANSFLQAIFGVLSSGAAVIDGNLNVDIWNDRAADLWGLRAEEAQGRSLLNLDIGLPIGQMLEPLRACASGVSQGAESVLEATTRRGKKIRCRVTVRPLAAHGEQRRGAVVLMDEVEE